MSKSSPIQDNNNIEEKLEALQKEHSRVLAEWYKDCESLHKKIVELEQENQTLRTALRKALGVDL
jgi:uncharacterized protein Yka (UPF0111/DUF47 family)